MFTFDIAYGKSFLLFYKDHNGKDALDICDDHNRGYIMIKEEDYE